MNRDNVYISFLEELAKMQFNVALILEAKALEAEKAKNWFCNHLSSAANNDHDLQFTQAIEIHQQMVDVIDGLTKMEAALGRNLKVVLGHNESTENGGFGGNDFFGMGGQT